MTTNGILQIVIYFLVIAAVAKPMGVFMTRVFAGERTFLHPVLRPLERLCYKLGGVKEDVEQRWTQYAGSMLAFSVFSAVFLYALQRLQGFLPLNPAGFSTAHAPANATAMTPDLAFNTAVSFTTNTNWQSYGGETTLSYLVQMLGLTMHNFTSAAVGIAIAVAMIRGFSRHQANALGNFWADIVRATVYVLLPIALVFALFLTSQGVIQNLKPYTTVDHRRRQDADHCARPRGVAGSHQDAGHQWRRILQCQLSASFRESESADELLPDDFDLPDPGRIDLRVRQDGEGSAPGLGSVRGDERSVSGGRFRRVSL